MLSSWVGVGSGALWAVEVQINSQKEILGEDGRPLPVIQITYKPRVGSTALLKTQTVKVMEVPKISGTISAIHGFYNYNNSFTNISEAYFIYDPFKDIIYKPSDRYGSTAWTTRIIEDFENSIVYKSFAFARQGQTPPIVDISGLLVQLVNAVKVPIILLISVMITFKTLDWGSRVLVRGFEEKQSQKKLESIMGLEDPLAFQVALKAHERDHKDRYKRYAKEDRRRKRSGF